MDGCIFFLLEKPTQSMKSQQLRFVNETVAINQDLLRRSQHGLKQFQIKKMPPKQLHRTFTKQWSNWPVAGLLHTNPPFSNSTLNHTPRPHGVWGEKKIHGGLQSVWTWVSHRVQARVSDTKWVNCTGHHVALTWAKAPPSNPDWPMEQTFTFSFSIPINLNHVSTDPSRICVAFGQSGWVASSGTSPDPKNQVSFCVGAWSQLTV